MRTAWTRGQQGLVHCLAVQGQGEVVLLGFAST